MLERLRRFIKNRPEFNALLPWVFWRYRVLAVRPDTEIVIEGFPRCANTFAVVAFLQSQPEPSKIAHHLHSIGQVQRGVEHGVPCLILIRNPHDAVLSLAIRKQLSRLEFPLQEYIDFYAGIQQLRDSVVLADFAEVTGDFGLVIDRLNKKYGTNFARFEHSQENVDACYAEIDRIERDKSDTDKVRATHVARPSIERARLKRQLEDRLQTPQLQRLVAEASAIYFDLTASLPAAGETFCS